MVEDISKFGVIGALLLLAMFTINKLIDFAAKRGAPPRPANGVRLAGEVPPEYYDKRFDKIDAALYGIVELMKSQAAIMNSIKDMLIREEGRRSNGES